MGAAGAGATGAGSSACPSAREAAPSASRRATQAGSCSRCSAGTKRAASAASSGVRWFCSSRLICEALGVGGHFLRVYGGNSFEQKKPHPIGIETLMAECEAARDRTMMVGDSGVDIRTARNAQVKACGVTYGFQPETLAVDAPDLLFDRFEQIGDWVIAG